MLWLISMKISLRMIFGQFNRGKSGRNCVCNVTRYHQKFTTPGQFGVYYWLTVLTDFNRFNWLPNSRRFETFVEWATKYTHTHTQKQNQRQRNRESEEKRVNHVFYYLFGRAKVCKFSGKIIGQLLHLFFSSFIVVIVGCLFVRLLVSLA